MKGRGYPPIDSLEQDDTGEKPVKEQNGQQENLTGDTLDPTSQNTIVVDTTTSSVDPKYDAYFEMAELFYYSLGRVDSAEYYLNTILSQYDESDKIAKVLYALANIYKNSGDNQKADNLFQQVISEYPNSIFANESRKVLGLKIVEAEHDPSEALYDDASADVLNKRYSDAITKFSRLLNEYPSSNFVPNSLYSLGWMYENVFGSNDSAIIYYSRLKDGYPQTTFYAQVSGKLSAIENNQNGNEEVKTKEEETIEENTNEEKIDENTEEQNNEVIQNNNDESEIPKEVLEEIQRQNQENNKDSEDSGENKP